jgi:hypothetical protein
MDNNLPYYPAAPQQLSEEQQQHQSQQLSEEQQQHQSERIGGDGGDPTNDDHQSQRSRGGGRENNERERSPSDDHRIQRARGGSPSGGDDHQRSQRARGGGGRDNERSRREFETSRDSYARPFRRDRERDYDFDDDDYRPRSRSSYHDHDEEYYSSLRRRRRGENDYRAPRGPPSEYSGARAYPRDVRPSYGYMDHPASSRSFGVPQYPPSEFYTQSAVNFQTQSFQMYLATFRIQNPAQYREWYNKYLAHKKDPIRIPVPPIPGYVAIPVSRTQIPVGNTTENVSGELKIKNSYLCVQLN